MNKRSIRQAIDLLDQSELIKLRLFLKEQLIYSDYINEGRMDAQQAFEEYLSRIINGRYNVFGYVDNMQVFSNSQSIFLINDYFYVSDSVKENRHIKEFDNNSLKDIINRAVDFMGEDYIDGKDIIKCSNELFYFKELEEYKFGIEEFNYLKRLLESDYFQVSKKSPTIYSKSNYGYGYILGYGRNKTTKEIDK